MASLPARPNHTPKDPVAVVQAFACLWEQLDFDGIEALLAPDIRFANGPLPALHGRHRVAAYLRNAGPFDACRWDFLSIAADGPRVLTERIDHLVVRAVPIILPIMGTFEVRDGLIHEWRDYFDLAAYRAQWPG